MEIVENKTVHEHLLIKKYGPKVEPEVKNHKETTFDNVCRKEKADIPDPEKCLLWKLSLNRKDAFELMNADVDEIVKQCLKARRHLQAVEDSNRNLKTELRSLKGKYEDLLDKNRKDTRIIMCLKDSEYRLKQAAKKQEDDREALLNVKMNNQEKFLERQLLRDNLAQLLLKSQATSNRLKKINLKHKRIHDVIEEENKRGKENEEILSQVIKDLRLYLSRNDLFLEKWLEDNKERDSAIRHLQRDVEEGLKAQVQKGSLKDPSRDDKKSEESDKSDVIKPDTVKVSGENIGIEKESDGKSEELEALRRDWTRKKVLYEVAEKQKNHWMAIFKMLTKRMKNLSVEIVNVREWRIDLEAEKKDLLTKVERFEKLVSQKRRMKPVPPRAPTVEIGIQIKVQREANEMIRKIAFKCLSLKVEDSERYSKFAKVIKDMYLETLLEELTVELEGKQSAQIAEDHS